MQKILAWLIGCAPVLLAGCTQLPVDGPAYRDIHTGATTALSTGREGLVYTSRDAVDFQYALVDISPLVVQVLSTVSPDSFFRDFRGPRGGGIPVVKIGVGDVVQTSIFESSSGGLFVPGDASNRSGNYVTLPQQTVASNGTITIPYAGAIKAAGRTVLEVQHDIESKLSGRAIEPQVVINIVEQNAGSVTVIGDAGSNKFKLTGSGERILDMISKAGGGSAGGSSAGSKFAGYELYVTLQRKDRTATIPFTSLIEDPKENIYVAPGDIIYAYRQPKTFIAMGAVTSIGGGGSIIEQGQTTGVSGQFRFEQERLNLNEALAKAGGLTDSRANPAQVFLYRTERRDTLERMGLDLAKFPRGQVIIPTVYRANFRDPSSFFFAQRFDVRDKDVIYAANASANEVLKFLGYVNAWTSTASSAMISGRTIGDITAGAHVLTNSTTTVVSP